jgi:hypothetical protein
MRVCFDPQEIYLEQFKSIKVTLEVKHEIYLAKCSKGIRFPNESTPHNSKVSSEVTPYPE